MTRYSKSIGAFIDVQRVFEAAIKHHVVEYKLDSYSKAIAWRSRAYAFRKLLMANSEASLANVRGVAPSTPYDSIFISVPAGSPTVRIHAERPGGILTTTDGKPISITAGVMVYDPLQEEAERLAREANIEI